MEELPTRLKCIVFAAGKSTRMAAGRSKMLEPLEQQGEQKPMLAYTVDVLISLGYDVTVLIGYDGASVTRMIQQRYKRPKVDCFRVSQDDGSDLATNTAGTLKKHADQLVEGMADDDQLLLCVGDQPFMHLNTIHDFIRRHSESGATASILLADIKNTPMEHSTSTRVSVGGSGSLLFDTPPKEGPFDSYSTLIDVGVLLINKCSFLASIRHVNDGDVFSKLLCHLSHETDRVNPVNAGDPCQFVNVNEKAHLHTNTPRTREASE